MPRERKKNPAETAFDEITPDELFALADFLDREPLLERSMSIEMLDGFLTAILIGPELVMPSDYMPWIWDVEKGKQDADFADLDEANHFLGYIQGMNNRIAVALMNDPPSVMPVFLLDEDWDHREWLTGFAMGCDFEPEIWNYAFEHAPELFEPIGAMQEIQRGDEGWQAGLLALNASVIGIRDYFRAGEWRDAFEEVQKPFVRQGPKIGRNDPCPCGSGRKHKKCCGETGGAVH